MMITDITLKETSNKDKEKKLKIMQIKIFGLLLNFYQ